MIKNSYQFIIIGSSAAGTSAAATIATYASHGALLCISKSSEPSYNTCFLVDLIAGTKSAKDIALDKVGQNYNVLLNTSVISINREKKSVITSDNSEILYQKLLLTTGVRPFIPPFARTTVYPALSGLFTFHTLEDVYAMQQWIEKKSVRSAIIIGGGLTGLECADALHKKGILITIIEKNDQLLSRHLMEAGAAYIATHLTALGIRLMLATTVARVTEGNGKVHGVELADGTEMKADMIIIAGGTMPNSDLAKDAGLTLHHNHIAVNEYMMTSDPAIWAAGDVAAVPHYLTGTLAFGGTWADAVAQGRIAARAMIGNPIPYGGALGLINSQIGGLHIAILGLKDMAGDSVIEESTVREYRRIVVRNEIPVAVHYVGSDLASIAPLRRALLGRTKLTSF